MKKSYSLALGWWAAKWLCHIGVFKYIEENNIAINEVSWTSMWAIVWACFALWKTSDEIKNIAKWINILKLADLSFWKWIISGNKIYKFLEELFWDTKIEDTKIPLIIIATNLNSWEKVILKKWKIVDAVRSSISLPMIFETFELEKNHLIDWWFKSNLPILELDWDDVIAVSAVRDGWKEISKDSSFLNFTFKKWFFWYNMEVMKKLVVISMSTNEDLTIEIAKNNWKNIILLAPNLWEFEFHDFNKVDELCKKWYEEAKIKLYNLNQQCTIKEYIKKFFK